MTGTVHDIAVINSALRRFGAGEIFALDEDTELAAIAVPIYWTLHDAAFGLYHWKWNRRMRKLEQASVDPAEMTLDPATNALAGFGYRNAFNFPAEAIGAPEALYTDPRRPNDRYRDFMVEGRQVRCNASVLYGVFALRMTPDLWPPAFGLGFKIWLSSSYAVPVSHDDNMRQALEEQAIGKPSDRFQGGIMGRFAALDAANSGGVAGIGLDDTLTAAHFGQGGDWSGSSSGW